MAKERTLVLDDDDLDLLELVLGGALEPPARWLEVERDEIVILTDPENTHLARLFGGAIKAVRALPAAVGPQWDLLRRLPARDVAAHAPAGARAVVLSVPPIADEIEEIIRWAHAGDAVQILVCVSRRPPRPRQVAAAGMVRIAEGLGDAMRLEGLSVDIVIVPWPASAASVFRRDEIAAKYGADEVLDVAAVRTERTRDRVNRADGVWADALRELYHPVVANEIERSARGALGRGAVVLFTGFSGSGKSTLARALVAELEGDGTSTTLLDGDAARRHLSRELGFDRRSRELNVERIGYVASLVARHGGIAIAAPIAPFSSSRGRARQLAEEQGIFLLVHVSTPLEVCEARDRKGLYSKARAGEIPDFTGVSSPYEVPTDADLVIDTSTVGVSEAVTLVRSELKRRGVG